MKTIYARLGDLQMGDTLEDGTTLGSIGKTLDAIGIDILDTTGELRDMGDVIEELMGQWDNLTTAEKQATAIKLAGKYQYNNLLALLDNAEMYNEQLEGAENALGTIDEQQEIYMESLEGKLSELQTSFEGFINSIFNVEDIKPFIESITSLVKLVTDFNDSIGGNAVLSGAIGIAASKFSTSAAATVSQMYENSQKQKSVRENSGYIESAMSELGAIDKRPDSDTYNYAMKVAQSASRMTTEQLNKQRAIIEQMNDAETHSIAVKSKMGKSLKEIEKIYASIGYEFDEVLKSDQLWKQDTDTIVESLEQAVKKLENIDESKITSAVSNAVSEIAKLNTIVNSGTSTNSDIVSQIAKMSGGRYTDSSGATKQINSSMTSMISSLKNAGVTDGVLNDLKSLQSLMKNFWQSTEMFGGSIKLDSEEFASGLSKIKAEINNLTPSLNELLRSVDNMTALSPEMRENIRKVISQLTEADQTVKAIYNAGEYRERQQMRQNMIEDFINIAGGLSQVTASIQALHNLGDIWSDEDASTGEKILSTIENLSFTIPMLVTGFKQMRESAKSVTAEGSYLSQFADKTYFMNTSNKLSAYKSNLEDSIASMSIEDVSKATDKLGSSATKTNVKLAATKAAMSSVNVASRAASGGVKLLSSAISVLTGPVGIAITALTTIMSLLSDARERAIEAADEANDEIISAATSAAETLSSVSDARESMDELYEKYKDNGEITDELKDAINECADAIGLSISTDDLKRKSIDKTIQKIQEEIDAYNTLQSTTVTNGFNAALAGDSDTYQTNDRTSLGYYSSGVESYLGGDTSYHLKDEDGNTFIVSRGDALYSTARDLAAILYDSTGDVVQGGVGTVLGYGLTYDLSDLNLSQDSTYVEMYEGQTKLTDELTEYVQELQADQKRAQDKVNSLNEGDEGYDEALTNLDNANRALSVANVMLTESQGLINAEDASATKSLAKQQANIEVSSIKSSGLITDDMSVDEKTQKAIELLLQTDSVQLIRGTIGSDEFQSYITGLIQEIVPEATSGVVTDALAGNGVSERTLEQIQQENAEYLGYKAYTTSNGETAYRVNNDTLTIGMLSNLGYSDTESNEVYNSLKAAGISAEAASKFIDTAMIDYGLSYFDALNELTTNTELQAAIVNDDNKVISKTYDKLVENQSLEDAQQQYADYLVTEAAKQGQVLSSEDALQEAQELFADTTLTTAQKIEAYQGLMDGTYDDVDEAVRLMANGFKKVAGASDDVNDMLESEYLYLMNSQGKTKEEANQYIQDHWVAAGFSSDQQDELVSAINEQGNVDVTAVMNRIDELIAAGFSPETIYQVLYDAISNGDFAISDVSVTVESLTTDATEIDRHEQLKQTALMGTASYVSAIEPGDYVTDDMRTQAEELVEKYATLAEQLGLTDEQFASVDFSKSEEEVEKQLYDLADGIDRTDERVTNLFKTLIDGGETEYVATSTAKLYSGLSSDTRDLLEQQGFLEDKDSLVRMRSLLTKTSSDEALLQKILPLITAEDYSSDIDTNALGAVVDAKRRQQLSYQMSTTPGASSDESDDVVTEALSYGTSLGLTADQINSVNMQQPLEDIKTDLESMAYGYDRANENLNTYVDAMSELGGYTQEAVDKARENANKMSDFSDESLDALSDRGLFDEDNAQLLDKLGETTGWDEDLMVRVATYLDEDQMKEQLDSFSSSDDAKVFVQVQAATAVTDANLEDEHATAEQLVDAGAISQDLADTLEEASGNSAEFANAIDLLTTSAFESQRAFSTLDEAVDSVDWVSQISEIDDLNKQVEDAQTDLENLQNGFDKNGVEIAVNADDIEDAQDKIDDLKKQVKDKEFSLDLNITGDLLDKADQTIEAINDVKDAIDLIGDDYTVDADSLEQLVSVFPDILDNATITADGLVQLDQSVADSAITAAQSEIEAAIGSDTAKLDSAIEYAGAMADAYQVQADAFSSLASNEQLTQEELDEAKSESDAQLAEAKQQNMQDLDESVYQAFENEVSYSDQSTNSMMDNSAAAATAFNENMQGMVTTSANWANAIIKNAQAAYQAVASIGTESFDAGSVVESITTGAVTTDEVGNSVDKGDTVNVGVTGEYTSPQSQASQLSSYYQGLADVYNGMQGELQAHKYALEASSANITTPSNRTSSDSGSSSGGSGDGSGSDYDPKTKEAQEDELDRYERINVLLNDITAEYEKLNTEQDRLVGNDLADNMAEQITLLQKQIILQKEKLAIEQDEAAEMREQLANDYSITFDEDGYMTNYAQRYKELLSYLNGLIDQYNATTTEEGQEALETQIDAAQDAYDSFCDLVDNYDTLTSETIKDTLQEIEDLWDSIEDLQIEGFNKAVEATDSIKDLTEAAIDFNAVFSGRTSDDPFRKMATSAQKLAGYLNMDEEAANDYYDTIENRYKELMGKEGMSDAQKKFFQGEIDKVEAARKNQGTLTIDNGGSGYLDMSLQSVLDIQEQIRQFKETGKSDIFGEDSADLYDAAKTIFDQATSLVSDLESEMDSLRDAILDSIDDIGDRMDDRIQQLTDINDHLDHMASVVELVSGDEAYLQLNQVLASQYDNLQAQISSQQDNLKYWQDMLNMMQEGSEEYDKVLEKIRECQSDLDELIETSLENLQEQYTNSVKQITSDWASSAMGNDLDWIAQEWELINRNADYYLDDVNAAYEIQKLQGDYLDLLDGSNDLAIQQKITDQMNEQLGYLREKEHLSEYDVAYAQAQLEILQKQIALEEAQSAKNQLKLKRDAQGNYSYVYTADEGDVSSAEDDLLDAQNNAYNLSKNQMKETQADSLSALQDAYNTINDIWTNGNLTVEQKAARTQEIIDSLEEYLEATGEQLSTSEKNIINDYIGMWNLTLDENKVGTEGIYEQVVAGNTDAFDQIDTRWNTSITNWLQNLQDFESDTGEMYSSLVDTGDNWKASVDELSESVGEDFNDITDAVNECTDATNRLADANGTFIDQLRSDAGIVENYEKQLQDYAKIVTDTEASVSAYAQEVNNLKTELATKEAENKTLASTVYQYEHPDEFSSGTSDDSSGGSSGGSSGSGGGDGVANVGDTATLAWGDYYYDSQGVNPSGNMFRGVTNGVTIDMISGYDWSTHKYHIKSTYDPSYSDLGWVKLEQLEGYDTGGYTGEWSDTAGSGRLALLHQKEIVLNEDDTANILKAVDAVRQMTIELKNGSFESSVSQLKAKGAAAMSSYDGNSTVEQDIHVTAEFPNAVNADEIRSAILGLADVTVQYAHSTK